MDYKFAVINHATLKVSKFTCKDDLYIAINVIRSKDSGFTAFRYYEQLEKWVALDV